VARRVFSKLASAEERGSRHMVTARRDAITPFQLEVLVLAVVARRRRRLGAGGSGARLGVRGSRKRAMPAILPTLAPQRGDSYFGAPQDAPCLHGPLQPRAPASSTRAPSTRTCQRRQPTERRRNPAARPTRRADPRRPPNRSMNRGIETPQRQNAVSLAHAASSLSPDGPPGAASGARSSDSSTSSESSRSSISPWWPDVLIASSYIVTSFGQAQTK
jgi:hypothetical protein